jgi:tRNA1Val (adenine37-N6)-methyltransferase
LSVLMDITRDYFYNGKVLLLQPKKGYRASVDSCLLTYFISLSTKQPFKCVELGIGSGLLGIGLVMAGCVREVTGIEIQKELFDLVRQNIKENMLESSISVFQMDIRDSALPNMIGNSDIAVMNPPFWKAAEGRIPCDLQKQIACHETCGELEDWISVSGKLLKRKGRLFLVYPVRRMEQLFKALAQYQFSPQKICFVHPFRNSKAELLLLEARRGNSGNLEVIQPIYLRNRLGGDTLLAKRILEGKFTKQLNDLPDKRVCLDTEGLSNAVTDI